MGFNKIIDQINSISNNQRLRGTYFEYLVQAYLKNEPLYKNDFEDVWMLQEVPTEYSISRVDTGVDLVAKRFNGDLVAIQAKFYSNAIQKSNIDSFLGELGKNYYSSGIIVSSTDKWGKNAESALSNRNDVIRIGLSDLRNSTIDWSQFKFSDPNKVVVKEKKKLRGYQEEVINKAISHFENNDRGQLIMAPGTGKTFTSLKIAESLAINANKEQFTILYLVPGIQLLTQTLRSWNADTEMSISSMAITSDRNASKGSVKQDESNLPTRASDIGYPATTSVDKVLENFTELKSKKNSKLLVVFSTYHSIEVLGKAQENGFPVFDLIVADEAHRTTGATALGEEDSTFVKVHSDSNIQGLKRLYQTATPKLYGIDAKQKAEESSVVISSMDDTTIYGEVFYRLGFGDSITQGYLSDYKLMVLAVDESAIQKDMQHTLSDPENGLGIDDIGRIIGIWNGMIKRKTFTDQVSGLPMKRAIAFSRTIKDSKRISDQFENIINEYLHSEEGYRANVRHVDGGMNALEKNEALDWLASEDIEENSARILSNVRFLTEGIDVPNLDAIIFLSPRKSQIDIVQAVGRIIRKSKDKEYGYIILPIVIPTGTSPESVLDNNKNYDVIWQILNALRSVDERFEATVNKLQLNKKKPENIQIIGVGGAPEDPDFSKGFEINESPKPYQLSWSFDWEAVEGAIYGKIVQKVGDRKYLEDWSEDVAKIASRHISYIQVLVNDNEQARNSFETFVSSLRHNINDSISNDQAIEMLAQHLITLPIFEALFDEYSFARNNPVGLSMERIIDEFSKYGFEKEQKELKPFYESVKLRATGIDNAEAKQRIIITLYDKFFSTAFKSTTERLGIVFTPIEVVDFIVKSVDDILLKHFDKNLVSENVHILDPFTGTGTFIVQTLSLLKKKLDKGVITLSELTRKYTQELHANEIVLLSYYIAAINIEATFDEINNNTYTPFEGIILTDTFESSESDNSMVDEIFELNDERLKKQKSSKITAIIGNPPYSIGQGNANDDNQNISYPKLKESIERTYANSSKSALKKSLYDSYIKAFRWASNRIEDKGVIGFVTNGSFIDSSSTDGFRNTLYKEFNYIYVFNLRGDQRTVGDKSRKEGGKIFGSGSRTPIAITILVKDGSDEHKIFYKDIGDYLNRDQKLSIISSFKSIANVEWTEIIPDNNNDWINQRDPNYDKYLPMDGGYFKDKVIGLNSNRDEWVYGFNKTNVIKNVSLMVNNFNENVRLTKKIFDKNRKIKLMNNEPSFIKWSAGLQKRYIKGELITLDNNSVIESMYRPFTKKYLFYQNEIIERPGRFKDVFGDNNLVIYITGKGNSSDFSAIVTDCIPNLQLQFNGQGFYLIKHLDTFTLFKNATNITEDAIAKMGLSSEEIFYYVYSVLHSNHYKEKYINDLQKEFPKIPFLKDKEMYVEIGKQLVNLHLNYESIPHLDSVDVEIKSNATYKVKKMRFASKSDKSTIVFNSDITIKNIPLKAYDYIVNGKPAIQWIMEQYSVPNKSKSGIIDDPNSYSEDPKYILNLLLSIISLSVKTVDLIETLPLLQIEDEKEY